MSMIDKVLAGQCVVLAGLLAWIYLAEKKQKIMGGIN